MFPDRSSQAVFSLRCSWWNGELLIKAIIATSTWTVQINQHLIAYCKFKGSRRKEPRFHPMRFAVTHIITIWEPTTIKFCWGCEESHSNGTAVLRKYLVSCITHHEALLQNRKNVLKWYGYGPGEGTLELPHYRPLHFFRHYWSRSTTKRHRTAGDLAAKQLLDCKNVYQVQEWEVEKWVVYRKYWLQNTNEDTARQRILTSGLAMETYKEPQVLKGKPLAALGWLQKRHPLCYTLRNHSNIYTEIKPGCPTLLQRLYQVLHVQQIFIFYKASNPVQETGSQRRKRQFKPQGAGGPTSTMLLKSLTQHSQWTMSIQELWSCRIQTLLQKIMLEMYVLCVTITVLRHISDLFPLFIYILSPPMDILTQSRLGHSEWLNRLSGVTQTDSGFAGYMNNMGLRPWTWTC